MRVDARMVISTSGLRDHWAQAKWSEHVIVTQVVLSMDGQNNLIDKMRAKCNLRIDRGALAQRSVRKPYRECLKREAICRGAFSGPKCSVFGCAD